MGAMNDEMVLWALQVIWLERQIGEVAWKKLILEKF